MISLSGNVIAAGNYREDKTALAWDRLDTAKAKKQVLKRHESYLEYVKPRKMA